MVPSTLSVITILASLAKVEAFHINHYVHYYHPTLTKIQSTAIGKSLREKTSQLQLVPLCEFSNVNFLSLPESDRLCIGTKGQLRPYHSNNDDTSPPYVLCVAEEDDLPSITRLTVDAFGAGTVTLSGDLNEFERALIGPTVGLWNEYTDILAYTEVLSGLRSRMSHRFHSNGEDNSSEDIGYKIDPPSVSHLNTTDAFALAAKSSLILVLAQLPDATSDSSSDTNFDCVATVELRLQPTDGKIPFSQPWLDKMERKIAKFLKLDPSSSLSSLSSAVDHKLLQPYLSNLCVSKEARGRRIGKALVRCVESIATTTWGYQKLYLHVDLENTAALNLYKGEGFQDVGFRWNPFWSGKSAEIGYFVKEY